MNKKNIFKKFILIGIGILIIASFEFIFFLSGKTYLNSRQYLDKEVQKYTIVCLGNSHTFGVGTSCKYNYPEQLEILLKKNNPDKKIRVVNLGIPGDTTSNQVKRLSKFLNKNKVDIVIFLTGRNNQLELKSWKSKSITKKIIFKVQKLRIYKIIKYFIDHISNHKEDKNKLNFTEMDKYESYMRYHLSRTRDICKKSGCRLLLISYYNSYIKSIGGIAKELNIPYFDISREFLEATSRERFDDLISPDNSHLNCYGYKLFSEILYDKMFLNEEYISFEINPLMKKINSKGFYQNTSEIREALLAQKKRIEDMPGDPFELVHLGHIYMEIAEDEKAKEFYLKALKLSGYLSNNTIVSPIINWYIDRGMNEKAYEICKKIISNNEDNYVAKRYLQYLEEKLHNK